MLAAEDRGPVRELAPLLRRVAGLDAFALIRLRLSGEVATAFAQLPFEVLVARSVHGPPRAEPLDAVARADDVLSWLDAAPADSGPVRRDDEWRSGLPPQVGWRRLEAVPDDVVRGLVRKGALAVQELAVTQSLPSGQAGPQAGAALLDTAVLTVTDGAGPAVEVTLRALSALTRMGFLPRGGTTYVDTAGRWTRVVAGYGTVYLERAGSLLTLR